MPLYKATIWTRNSAGGVQKIEDTVDAVNATTAQEVLMRKWSVSRSEVGSVMEVQSAQSYSSQNVRQGGVEDDYSGGMIRLWVFASILGLIILFALFVQVAQLYK
jgi:hypothetical protein